MSRCEKCGDSFTCAEHKQTQCGLSCPPDWHGHWRDWHSEDHNCPTKGRLASEQKDVGAATAAWEAHKKAYEIVRAEMDDLHRALTQCGVPEQIPPFKTALAPAKARILYLSARCNQLFNEAADAQKRLDQFEAYAITVKSALDDRADRDALRTALVLCVDVLPGLEVRNWPPGFAMKKAALDAARAALAASEEKEVHRAER